MGAVSAQDLDNVSIKEDSNLDDNAYSLSSQNKLEISNEVSISEANIVNSQNDNLGDYSSNDVLSSSKLDDNLQASSLEAKNNTSNNDENALESSENNILSAKGTLKVPVILNVTSAISSSDDTHFKVSVKDSETGKAVTNSKVLLILTGKNYLGLTDDNGIAEIITKALAKGTYNVTLKFAGTISRYEPALVTQEVDVFRKILVDMNVTSAVSDSKSTIFKVSVKDSENGKAVSGNKVLLILDGKNYLGVTDKNGVANFTTKALAKGTYPVTLKFAGTISRYDATIITQNVDVFRKILVDMKVTSAVSDNESTIFKVSVKDSENGKAVTNSKVLLILTGKNYLGVTDDNGIAEIITKSLAKGTYPVTLKFAGTISRYDQTIVTQNVNVFRKIPVILTVMSATQSKSKTLFNVSVLDSETGKGVANNKVLLILDGKNYVGTTNKNGIASITTKALAKGTYDVTLKFAGTVSRYEPTVTTQKVGVGIDQVSLSNVISASKTVKNYIENNEELPSSVTINGVSYNLAQYLYLASKAILNLKNGDKSAIDVIKVNNPKSYTPAGYLGNLNDYYSVARRVINHAATYDSMPSYAISDVGNIGYDGLVYAFARVVAFYGDQSEMPNYVTIKSISQSVGPDAVNTRNTITDLAPYLKATTNCQVNNAQIQALAAKLTSGLTSPSAKATAIYNYVRDSISYSFYYDTRYGAVGTLNSKTGNCVDQAHLLIALYRASDLPARYAHGTCTFSSGTYGHVWTQVLLGDIWTVGDPTSTRNSLGSIANWNTNTFSLKGYYASISF